MTSATMSCVGVFDVDANLQEKDSVDCYSGEMLLSESPRTVSGIDAFVCVRDSSALPSPPFGKKLPGPRPFEDGTVDVKRCARKRRIRFGSLTASGGDATRSYKMAYRIYRPELLGSTERAPIVAIHGGPSLPSQYLYPLAEQFPDRSVIFYDQLGCGKSCSPSDLGVYGLAKSVDDLESLLDSLKVPRFHLFGHSFGGVIAYEYCKRLAEKAGREDPGWMDDPDILSVMLSNTFTCAKLCNTERDRLLSELSSGALSRVDTEEDLEEKFWQLHQCCLSSTPSALEDAINHWGVPWHERPSSPLSSYTALPPSRWASDLPPALIIRGERDFVTPACVKGWRGAIWNHEDVTEATLKGCAHYCHLEDATAFGSLAWGFCQGLDP
eukprot:CAMPEP_0197446296 /NCGR_PEP_ID=MMETSP1175-20131217/11277_1 /TAXON_ID=1003142 /ORGANISM="Triceratium dubium, Strain CCMP147" /LENGTH=382 /DNA_ID=CAMNT_0042977381 /DNA_START=215 /DNA_END=1363 /DNA_ORIENTATION=+